MSLLLRFARGDCSSRRMNAVAVMQLEERLKGVMRCCVCRDNAVLRMRGDAKDSRGTT